MKTLFLMCVFAATAFAQDTVLVSKQAVSKMIADIEGAVKQNETQDREIVRTLANPSMKEAEVLHLRFKRLEIDDQNAQYRGVITGLQRVLSDSALWVRRQ